MLKHKNNKLVVASGDVLLLVSINKSFNQDTATGVYKRSDIYEATRKYWAIKTERAKSIKYVLGVYKGIVRSVIEVKSFKWIKLAEDGTEFKRSRCSFEGTLLNNSDYLNCDVSDFPFGKGGAIRYVENYTFSRE